MSKLPLIKHISKLEFLLNMKNIFVTAIILFFAVGSMQAGGPWPQKKGKGYFKLSEWWVIFDQHYTDRGLLDPNITTGVFNTSIYAEYGITDQLTTILNAPFLSRNYMNNLVSATTNEVILPGEAINTFGDIDLGLKYGLTPSGKIPIAITVMVGIPTGKTSGGTQNNLQTGDGEFNQLIQLDVGGGFSVKKTSLYTSAYVGFNNRTKGYSEELRFGLESGAGLFDNKLWLTGKLNMVESLKNGDTAETITSTSLFANNAEFTSLTLEASYYVTKKIGVSASFASPLRGEIIAAAPSYSVGVFFDMSK